MSGRAGRVASQPASSAEIAAQFGVATGTVHGSPASNRRPAGSQAGLCWPARELRGDLRGRAGCDALDRLARSTRDLLNVIDAVSRRGARFRSLKDAWADTTSAHGRLMLTVVSGLAEFERGLIRARTGEGRKRAQERGDRFGRPRKLTPFQRQEA